MNSKMREPVLPAAIVNGVARASVPLNFDKRKREPVRRLASEAPLIVRGSELISRRLWPRNAENAGEIGPVVDPSPTSIDSTYTAGEKFATT